MLKISDILKKNRKKKDNNSDSFGENKAAGKDSAKSSEIKKNSKSVKQQDQVLSQKKKKESPAVLPAATRKFKNLNNQEAGHVYKEAISLVEQVDTLSSQNWESFYESAKKIIDRFINILENDEDSLLRLFFYDYSSLKGYLYQHSVNVCILSLFLSQHLKYSKDQLQQMGLIALLHDVGLVKYDDLISLNKRFGQDEYAEVKKHPINGRNILEKVNENIPVEILEAICQEHERLDGSGYPHALEGKAISEKARLIGLIDSYESMMHARPYRDKFKSEDVIKFFTQQKVRFEYKFLKALIDLVGVFPVLTPVKLNTREMGVVIRQNYQMPLKPVIKITHSAQGQKIDSPKAIDLAVNYSIYVQECFISTKTKDEKKSE